MHAGFLQLCPHCAQPLRPVRYGVTFGPIATKLIDTIADAGPRGVSGTDLSSAIYGSPGGTRRVRTYVSAINRLLAQRGSAASIRGDRRVYRIVIARPGA